MSAATKTLLPEEHSQEVVPVRDALSDPSIPLLHEDDGYEDMGDSDIHTRTTNVLYNGLPLALDHSPGRRVFCNMNLYYSTIDRTAYVSPDLMVVEPAVVPADDVKSYRMGDDGPAPLFVTEVLSERTFQQRDLTDKLIIYAEMKVPEYLLVDVTGEYLSVRLLLKRLRPDGAWKDVRDSDGGITSKLGFRVVLDDGQVRIVDVATGKRYLRPSEAQATTDELNNRVLAMEAEIARLQRKGRKKRD